MYPCKTNIHRALRSLCCSLLRFRHIQKKKNLVAGRHSVHRDVKKRAQKTQRDKKLSRQKKKRQDTGQPDLPMRKFSDRLDHAHSCTSVGHDIHHAGRIELHSQHLHRNAPELLRFLVHFLRFLFICLIDFQRRQSLQILQEAVSQSCIHAPVFVKKPFGDLLHHNNGEWDQRHTEEKHCTCFHTHSRKYRK